MRSSTGITENMGFGWKLSKRSMFSTNAVTAVRFSKPRKKNSRPEKNGRDSLRSLVRRAYPVSWEERTGVSSISGERPFADKLLEKDAIFALDRGNNRRKRVTL